jgi:hypothetical protein
MQISWFFFCQFLTGLSLFSHIHSDKDRGRALVGAVKEDSNLGGAVYTTVEKRVVHPDYNKETDAYDFVVLKLSGWVRKMILFVLCLAFRKTDGPDCLTPGPKRHRFAE